MSVAAGRAGGRAVASSTAPLLFWRADPAGRWMWSCAGWTAVTGLSEAASRGDGWVDAVHPEDRSAALKPWPDRDCAGSERACIRIQRTAGGGCRLVRPTAAPARRPDGTLQEWVGNLADMADERAGPLRGVDDLQHHMRNALAVIRSVARRTARNSDSVEHHSTHFEGRLDAMARVHDAIVRSRDGGVDLGDLVGEELVACRVDEANVRIDGPPLRLKGRAAEGFGLAVHELVVNAVKFGALASPRGMVSISWAVNRGGARPCLAFRWSESGVAVASAAPRRCGFGTEMIERSLPYELNAATRLDFHPGGILCTVTMPLTDELASPDA